MHKKWNNDDTQVIYSDKMPDVAAWFDTKEVFPLKIMKFEGLEFYVPHNPDYYLNAIYTFNYRKLLPADKRIIHADEVIIHSCS